MAEESVSSPEQSPRWVKFGDNFTDLTDSAVPGKEPFPRKHTEGTRYTVVLLNGEHVEARPAGKAIPYWLGPENRYIEHNDVLCWKAILQKSAAP